MNIFGIAYIVCGVIFLVASIMDGQDVKPIWMRWVGVKLAKVANYYYRIDYCRRDDCYWVREYQMTQIAHKQVSERMNALEEKLVEIMSLNAHPKLFITDYSCDKVEERLYVDDGVLMQARFHEDMALRNGGFPLPRSMRTDYIIEEAKEKCINSIYKRVRDYIEIDVQKDRYKGGIYIIGSVVVGKERKNKNYEQTGRGIDKNKVQSNQ